jgi:NAD(P)-dependent dehydrogenase (short-subunit alcohol dehydrogenase family)
MSVSAFDDSPVPDYAGLLRLDGRGFVVAGAGQGIGRQTAHALAAAGARVVCVDLERARAERVAAEVGGIAWCGDVRERADAERLIADAGAALGRLHGLVDIVGMARFVDLVDTTDDDWQFNFDMVLRHAFLLAQLGGCALRDAGGGVLVFVASASALTSAPHHAAYGAAKAALLSLVRTAAVELGPSGVRVNAVAPGMVWTPRVSALLGEEGRARNEANAPLRRIALPEDVASAILFLACDLARHVTGHTLVVDGGVAQKFPYPSAG